MNFSREQSAIVLREAEKVLQNQEPENIKLSRLWMTLAYIRGSSLANAVQQTVGDRVAGGPFKGMRLTPEVMTGLYGPVLLGCYEHELHKAIEEAIARPYAQILNIGCAFGYYSVGLALRMPQAKIYSFDINAGARRKCEAMAALNGVGDRVKIAGEFHGEDFAAYADKRTLVIMDIESAEMELLDPARFPALQKMDIIVELHDLMNRAISKTVMGRFATTHDVELVRNRAMLYPFEQMMGPDTYIDPFDQLIATWEVRDGPTPWAVMRAKVS